MLNDDDTIAAISTAIGEGGIGIVRVSGKEAVTAVEKVFKNRKGLPISKRRSHSIVMGTIVDPNDGSEVDEVLVSVMRAPNTYTREDVVEVNCHGGSMALRRTLGLVIAAGARAAEPGEFTKRAFLNGRINLAQAEAVIDIIRSKTDVALKTAMGQLGGGLSNKISAVAETVTEALVQIEAAVDFSDEDIDVLPVEGLVSMLKDSLGELERLLTTSIKGRILKEGIRTAIVGRPNVGKSSLLNALLRADRAIVTPVPGTTRDIIEEIVNVNGVPLCLMDTAGIREADGEVERIGVELSRRALKISELVLCLIDGSKDVGEEDLALIGEIDTGAAILVINKSDLPQAPSVREIRLPESFKGQVEISALTGAGIGALEKAIEEIFFGGELDASDTAVITSVRHEQLVSNAAMRTREALSLLCTGQPEETISIVLRDVIRDLGEVTGESVGEDVLGRIFSQFCIGK
ncbi:MAG: tRNA uridine-5-carboxymethylaminomethyl(34) synthesis GTPase MnmE [Actinobacteria bacterium]|nr:tRNA uridine-5-carboxymethylaminomethyl(34) synthesis GTPase MnmE [Actinomycetota bacterium]